MLLGRISTAGPFAIKLPLPRHSRSIRYSPRAADVVSSFLNRKLLTHLQHARRGVKPRVCSSGSRLPAEGIDDLGVVIVGTDHCVAAKCKHRHDQNDARIDTMRLRTRRDRVQM